MLLSLKTSSLTVASRKIFFFEHFAPFANARCLQARVIFSQIILKFSNEEVYEVTVKSTVLVELE